MEISLRLYITKFSSSNGWIDRFKKSKMFPQNIFNADEAGLFFNHLPDKTYTVKDESYNRGKMLKKKSLFYWAVMMTVVETNPNCYWLCFKNFLTSYKANNS